MPEHPIYNAAYFERQEIMAFAEESHARGEDEVKDCPFVSKEYVEAWQQGFAMGRLKKVEPFAPF